MTLWAKRALGFILLCSVTFSAHAEILFSESWNSSLIDYWKWSVYQTNGSVKVVDIGGGDRALQLGAYAGDFDAAIYTRQVFPRGYLIYCQFKVWHDVATKTPAGMGFFGPWRQMDSGPSNANIEAGISGSWNNFVWDENAGGTSISSPPAIRSIGNAFANATSKATALTVRVTLGDQTGSLLEFSTNGGANWIAGSFNTSPRRAVDSVGQRAGTSWHNLLVGSNKENHIGFGPGGPFSTNPNAHLYIDDIVVQNLYAEHNPSISYVTPNAPSLPIPPYRGQWYQDTIPDTLDLAERCELAINAMTCGTLNTGDDYSLNWHIELNGSPPDASWLEGFPGCRIKWQESLPLLRMATGCAINMQVDRIFEDSVTKSLASDGCYFADYVGRRTTTMALGRGLTMMLAYYAHDRNPFWLAAIKKQVDAINSFAVKKTDPVHGDYAHVPWGTFDSRKQQSWAAPMLLGIQAVDSGGGRIISGMGSVYLATHYAPALSLAKQFANYIRYESQNFNSDTGEFLTDVSGSDPGRGPHFHAHTHMLDGMMDYVLATQAAGNMDQDYLAFVLRSYNWGRNHRSSNAHLGFFPETLGAGGPNNTVESCELGDMIMIALKLAQVAGDQYWDDVDRWVRNQLAECQMTRTDWIYEMVNFNAGAQPTSDADRVPLKCLGAYAGYCSNSDWGQGISQCCMGNASRALYYAWKDILTYNPDAREIKVNLLLNRASAWADVYSYIPYSGQVDLKIKRNLSSLLVRMPEWVPAGDSGVSCTVNGAARALSWQGKYVSVGPVVVGDQVQINFGLYVGSVQETVGLQSCTISLRGNTVTSLGKTGSYCPVYQRSYFNGAMPWRTVQRFASAEEPDASSAVNEWSAYK